MASIHSAARGGPEIVPFSSARQRSTEPVALPVLPSAIGPSPASWGSMSLGDSFRLKPPSERKVTRLGLCDSRYGSRPSLLWIIFPLLLVHPACGQNDTFNIVPSTNQPVQCGSYWFFWIGGTPPFEMQVGTIDNTQHIDTAKGIQGSSWLWEPVDLLSGTHLVLLLTDSTGRQTIDTSWAVVQPSDDDLCLPEEEQGGTTTRSSTTHSASVSSSVAPMSTSSTRPSTITSSPTTTPSLTRTASTSRISTASSTTSSSRQSSSTQLLPTGAVANSSLLSSSSSASPASPPQSSSETRPSASSTSAPLPLPFPSAAVDSATGQKSMSSGVIAGIVVGAVALLLALLALLWCYKRRRRVFSPSLQRPEDLSDVDPFSAFPTAPSPSVKRAMSPFMYDRSSSAMSPFRAASPSMSTPTPSVLLLRDHAGSSTYPQDGSVHATYTSEFSPYAAYATQPNDNDPMLPRPLVAKTSMAELSARSGSATALLGDHIPRTTAFPGGYHRRDQDPESASDNVGRRVTATDGGVRLAGGPTGEAPQTVSARSGEMFPPPYHRY